MVPHSSALFGTMAIALNRLLSAGESYFGLNFLFAKGYIEIQSQLQI